MPTNSELRQFVVDHFDHADLDLLIADYFVSYRAKEIPGLGLEIRAQNLIDYCGKAEQMANLGAALQAKHPKPYRTAFGTLDVAPVPRLARDPQKCFISHASKDAEFAQQLGLDLQAAGAPIWIAPDSIEPSEIWMRAIERGLKECGVFVCVLTPNALESEWVKSETEIAIALAKSGEMRIFVLMVEACKTSELSIWLTRYQHIRFIDRYASGLRELKLALGFIPPEVKPATSGPVTPSPRQSAPQPTKRSSPGDDDTRAAAPTSKPLSAKSATPPTAPPLPKRSNPAAGDSAAAALTIDDMPMCYVPPGEFIMGGDGPFDGKPEHPQKVAQGLWISKYTVTNAQFKMFVGAGGYKKQDYWTEAIAAKRWKDGRFRGRNDNWRGGPNQYGEPFGRADHPVVGVSWYEALAFTRWLQERIGVDSFGLPGEAQWEYAARGPRFAPKAMTPLIQAANAIRDVSVATVVDFASEIKRGATSDENRRIYPWGDDADPKKMNFEKSGIGTTSAVGTFPDGVSLFGCEDMSGNVWEWTMTKWTNDYKEYDRVVDNRPDGSEGSRVVRGGAFSRNENRARCACRHDYGAPYYGISDISFRVVASPIYL